MKFDVVIIGAGKAGSSIAQILQARGLNCALVTSGASLNRTPIPGFFSNGGTFLPGNRVLSACVSDGKVLYVNTENTGRLEADNFVLCTGKFFSRGLVADMDRVYEPVFDLPVKYEQDRSKWFDPDFAAPQPFMGFGVEDPHPLDNLYLAGEILAGDVDIEKTVQEVCRRIA